ncbi:phytanoyl-CoA dioxygenase family protein [Sphingobium chungbukense]|uniref:Phytanoyl-CoA dioxygenase n=1 Tax=Sphingobium chungbukense TaxID=56193 RepID=A0A0M3ANP0_9SPHN|nr:phytanoyl-CoA dioxygenase family protein [Sphingobium chungbukense]KKW90551.1 hypothetical protein YP76_18325 [Sphingobium chungbukense]
MSKLRTVIKVATDPRWWPFYAQRRILSPDARNAIAGLVARRRPQARITAPQLAEAGAANLDTVGIHHMGGVLTTDQCAELREYFLSKKVFDPYRVRSAEFLPDSEHRDKRAHVAHHRAEDILAAPWLLHLANDSRILDIASTYLGCRPTIGYMACWWSYPTEGGPQHAEYCHRDVDDWRFVKLFVYLTDVGPRSGPHVYVRGSGNDSRLVKIRRFSDEEVFNTFGSDRFETMTGKAGEAFFENTYGIHKGQPVEDGSRLIFQVVYSLNPLPYSPVKPVRPNTQPELLDPWINRIYLR